MLCAPLPWFAGSKRKGLSWASLCFSQHLPPPTSPGLPCRGRFLGQVASLRLSVLIYRLMDPLAGRLEGIFVRILEKHLAQGLVCS